MSMLDAERDARIDDLERAMRGHILDERKGWPHPRGDVLSTDLRMVDGCDDNCAADIFDRLTERSSTDDSSSVPSQTEGVRPDRANQ